MTESLSAINLAITKTELLIWTVMSRWVDHPVLKLPQQEWGRELLIPSELGRQTQKILQNE